jgi:aminocarboxymuconate-semialdehyde decarboxylase
MAVVDVHTHFVPLEFVDLLRSGQGPADVEIVDRDGADPLIVHDNGMTYPVMPSFHDVDAKLEQMDQDGIDMSIVSIVPSLFLYWSEPEDTIRASRLINDAAADFVSRGGGRIQGMATVPLNAPHEAAAELRRAHSELGLCGVEIGTAVGDVQLDDPSLDEFFSVAEELGMPLMIHPYVGMIAAPTPARAGYHLGNVVGNPDETFATACRLIVGGVFDRHPGLNFLLVHGGGTLPYQLARLDHAYDTRAETKSVVKRRPLDYLQHFLFDTVLFDPRPLDYLIEFAGADRVLFGTDVPFDMADLSGIGLADRRPDVAEQVLGGNAIERFGIRAVTRS